MAAAVLITARTRLSVQVAVEALSDLVKQRRAAHPYYFVLLLKVLFDEGQNLHRHRRHAVAHFGVGFLALFEWILTIHRMTELWENSFNSSACPAW